MSARGGAGPEERRWRAKLEREHPNHGTIVAATGRMRKHGAELLIPRPLDVEAVMRRVRRGDLITYGQLRRALADEGGADGCCPLTTGIFVHIVAEAAEEDLRFGKKRITPYWRTVRDDGVMNERYPGGAAAHAERLVAEGFDLEDRGGRPARLRGHERAVARGGRRLAGG